MIHEKEIYENTIIQAINSLKIGQMLTKAEIKKENGISSIEIFKFLKLLVFRHKNLYRFLESDHNEAAFSKNTYIDF